MAGSRTDKSTIPEGRDPLAGVSYSQKRPPIDTLIADTTKEVGAEPVQEPPQEAIEAPPKRRMRPPRANDEPKGKVTVLVSETLLERLRNAAYWKRETLAALAEDGIRLIVQKLEREHGGPFQTRRAELKAGRPQGGIRQIDDTETPA